MAFTRKQAGPVTLTKAHIARRVEFARRPAGHLATHTHTQRCDRVARDEVGHAADRVRAIQGRRRPFDHFDAFEPGRGLPTEIDGADERLSIEQHEHLTGVDSLNLFSRRSSPTVCERSLACEPG